MGTFQRPAMDPVSQFLDHRLKEGNGGILLFLRYLNQWRASSILGQVFFG